MKQIKNYALGLVGAALLAAGLYACSTEDVKNSQGEATSPIRLKSGTFTGGQIAVIKNGIANPLYDEAQVKAELINDNTFESIESIELVYGRDTTNEEAFVTIIGVEKATSQTVAIVADLTIDGDRLIIENPDSNQQSFATHSCIGTNCRSCQFQRGGFLNLRIIGCKPCASANDDSLSSACNHSQTSGGSIILKASETLVKYAS